MEIEIKNDFRGYEYGMGLDRIRDCVHPFI